MPLLLLKAFAYACVLLSIAAPSRAMDPATYAYVLFGQGETKTVPMARVIINVPNQPCPTLSAPGQKSPVTMMPRTNPHPKTFAVTVCEARYPSGQSLAVRGTSIMLPKISTETPMQVVVLGDTGCRDDHKQKCTGHAWPFARIAATVSADKPDLVIHVGDYNYRGTPSEVTLARMKRRVKDYDAGGLDSQDAATPSKPEKYYSQNMAASTQADNWAAWKADFFDPAKSALAAAPWVFVRGNHEACNRAGPGFFYFLDSSSKLLGGESQPTGCPGQDGSDRLRLNPPYKITLGSLELVVIDSANADDTVPWRQRQYNSQMIKATGMIDKGTPTWVLSHRPFWGVKKGKNTPSIINKTLQAALKAASGGEFPADVKLIVSGHMHRFQAISFEKARPTQLIVGNSGVALSKNYPDPGMLHPTDARSVPIDGATGNVVGRSDFGYMRIKAASDGTWSGVLLDPNAKELAECKSAWGEENPPRAVCEVTVSGASRTRRNDTHHRSVQ